MTRPLTDVVQTWEAAHALDRPPLIVREPLEDWLDAEGLTTGLEAIERVGSGLSNATFRLITAGQCLILRRPPRPPTPPSTHDVLREARVLTSLEPAGLPVPRVLARCADESVIGAPFYVMDHIEGTVIIDELPTVLDNPDDRRRIAWGLVDALVAIHALDWRAQGLADYGRPEGYVERQVARFRRSWDRTSTREIPRMREVADWLDRNMPPHRSPTIVHGDFRLANAMFAQDSPTRLLAVLDWEMATIGDPLADLGFLAASWWQPGDPPTMYEALSPIGGTASGPRRAELVRRYQERSGRSVDDLPWFRVLGLWKTAVIMEGNYRRYLEGSSDTAYFEGLDYEIPRLAEAAWEGTGSA